MAKGSLTMYYFLYAAERDNSMTSKQELKSYLSIPSFIRGHLQGSILLGPKLEILVEEDVYY